MTTEVRIGVDRRGGWRADVAGRPRRSPRFDSRAAAERWALQLDDAANVVVCDAYERVIGYFHTTGLTAYSSVPDQCASTIEPPPGTK
jgi:hypothetical protein